MRSPPSTDRAAAMRFQKTPASPMPAFFFCAGDSLRRIGADAGPAQAACPQRSVCQGGGRKGGPGYRGPDGKCVGFANLAKVCGNPSTTCCVFENAPGAGANRECAGPSRKAAPPQQDVE